MASVGTGTGSIKSDVPTSKPTHLIKLGESWKDIIFLPFNRLITIIFMVATYMSVIWNIYMLTYKPIRPPYLITLFIDCCNLYYFVYIVVIILHRMMRVHRQRQIYKCHPLAVIIIDVISLFPLGKFYGMINSYTWEQQFSQDELDYSVCYLKFLRIWRLFYFYNDLRTNLMNNQTRVIFMCHFLASILVIVILGAIYYECGMSPPPGSYRTWMHVWLGNNASFDQANNFNWFIITSYEISGLYFNNALIAMEPANNNDMILVFIAMLLGFISQYTFLLGTLTSEELQGMRAKYILQLRLKSASRLMETLKMPPHFKHTVQSYYETIWNYRVGVVTMPPIITKLTPFMQDEIYTDIYWEALLHTKLFHEVSSVFRKVLASLMHTQIYLAGHFIFKANDVKAKLVYLQSGMVEIFRMEAEDTRITLTSGSVFGEMSCFQASACGANLRCVTTCTIHVLYMVDLHKKLKHYPFEFRLLRDAHQERIRYASVKLKMQDKEVNKVSHMKWVKTQWRNIFERSDTKFDPGFSSRFLDMIAMTNADKNPNAFCLRGNCPFVMRRETALHRFFERIALASTILNFFYSFRVIIFEGGVTTEHYKLFVLLDSILILDIYIQIITTARSKGTNIDEPYELLVYKLKNVYFISDFVASVPFDYFMLAAGSSPYTSGLTRITRFIRLYKIVLLSNYYEKRVTAYSGFLKVLKFCIYHIIFTLLLTGLVYLCICFGNECDKNTWLEETKEMHRNQFGIELPTGEFLLCFYYTVNIYLKLVLRVYIQRHLPGVIVKTFIVILGYYMLTVKLAEMCAMFGLRYESKHLLLEYAEMIDIYVQEHKQLKKYKNQLLECLSLEWMISAELRFKDLCQVTYQESRFIRRSVNDQYLLYILTHSEFFKHMPSELLQQLAHSSDFFFIPEKHKLISVNDRCFYLYIVVEGYCQLKSMTPGDWEQDVHLFYTRFQVFPVVEYLHQVDSLVEAYSYTDVQLISIPYSVYEACISVFYEELHNQKVALASHMMQYWGLLQRRTVSHFLHDPKKTNRDKPKMFWYRTKKQKLILDITNTQHQQYGDSCFLTYRRYLKIIMLNTYSPNSKSYVCYETFRCFCCLLHVNLIYYISLSEVYHNTGVHITTYFLYVLWLADMFIKAHLDYYNDAGILVQGLKQTTKHYIKTSFALDFIAGLPYDLMQVFVFVSKSRQMATEILILLNTRVFFLVRPLKLSVYAQGDGVTFAAKFLKYFTIIMLIYHSAMHLSCIKLMLTCDVDDMRRLVCANNSWIMLRRSYLGWEESQYYWICVSTVLSTGVMPADSVSQVFDHCMTLILAILIVMVRIALICKITGDNCIRQERLLIHQSSLKRYNLFFKNRLVSNSTKAEMLDHYKNIWQKSYSEKSHKIFENIHPHLRETLLFTMYQKAIKKCILFQEKDEVLFKLFIPYLEVRYYKRHAEIIRVNDVQGKIYIVVKGIVEMSMADTRLVKLGPGGVFGCFEPLGLNRHTMAATAVQHANVLVMRSTRFYQLIKGFNKIESLMKRLRYTQFQYATLQTAISTAESFQSLGSTRSVKVLRFKHIYRIYMYLTNVHMAPLAAILVLIDCNIEFGVMKLLPLWILFDCYFATCFYFRARMPILDSSTGFELTRSKDLRRHYFKSLVFIMDVVTILPAYLIRIWMYKSQHQIPFLVNKTFRIFYLYNHYAYYIKAKNVPRHLHWTLLLYSTVFLAQLIFTLWWFLLDVPYEIKTQPVYIFHGYIYMINFISTTGLDLEGDKRPQNARAMVLQIIMVILGSGLTITLAQLFTKSVLSENAYECVYRFRAQFCRKFCQVSNVSEALIQRTWGYLHYLYKKQGGEQFPKLYAYAPRYLKQDHMQSLFGRHFSDHPLFYDLHIDLLKQIQTYIRCDYFTPGSTIVEKGHRNGKIYFIENGSVVAIHSGADDEAQVYEVLEAGRAFGEIQAFLNQSHNRTYRALTNVDVISVTVSEWEYLLEWFPASKQKLINRVHEHADLLKIRVKS